ncbi:tyrosyl-DNA phosphodiesterase 1 [Actinomortierella ambigua]|nr:tyrosyl-DNA phosphodiesterase 1 [Actinomortierella ambigua]
MFLASQSIVRGVARYIDPPFHLTAAQRLPPSHNVNCVTLESLLSNDRLQYMVQINYMIDIPFVMSFIPASARSKLRATFYHGLRHSQQEEEAMLLFYSDNTMQFVIHTANLIARDWRNKTQGVFSTGILHKKASEHLHSTCAFERDLQDYLSRYQNMAMTARVSQFDFSGVKGVLVASVPGSFSGQERNRWGHMRLRSVLRQQVELSQEARERSKIIIQISSIGSLGPEATDWLRGEFEVSLNAHRNQTYGGRGSGELAIVYPTVENVRTRYADKVLTVVPIRLPYDLPLTPYDRYRDHVWLSDKWFPGLDDYGKELQK